MVIRTYTYGLRMHVCLGLYVYTHACLSTHYVHTVSLIYQPVRMLCLSIHV